MELDNEDGTLSPRARLGRRLRRYRESRGLSLRAVGESVGFPHSYIGRVELGEQLPSESLAQRLDRFFETDGVLTELLELARDSLLPGYSRDAVHREPEAKRIQVFNSSAVPGLLQTEDYMKEVFRRSLPGRSEDDINELAGLRMRRQRILHRKSPPYYWAIMDEAALMRPMGGNGCMTSQLRHVLAMAARPYVTVQVLPFSQGAHPMMGGSLTLHTLRDGGTIAVVESFDSGEPVEAPQRVLELSQKFDLARSLAHSADESLALIRAYLEKVES
ncbi:helix-turn-helix domain-containing protein [Streptomyces spiramenti]|uniref:Helix-turn-helix domain-containing protein n=1 Tax=Streptomyces spiramenti TaxID=2720606 RepID=A0ABX1AHL6_9ACTN|nr:helix-turn-helix transcriptional regulator [Streptomyces spiramenti]NJP65416.1 helix-turn-helix domain-containing protein [Streptomyces spiramenti]